LWGGGAGGQGQRQEGGQGDASHARAQTASPGCLPFGLRGAAAVMRRM
jgi:hypothetical protein